MSRQTITIKTALGTDVAAEALLTAITLAETVRKLVDREGIDLDGRVMLRASLEDVEALWDQHGDAVNRHYEADENGPALDAILRHRDLAKIAAA